MYILFDKKMGKPVNGSPKFNFFIQLPCLKRWYSRWYSSSSC